MVEYAVRMKKLNSEKQMDHLLIKNKVTKSDIKSLAEKIADFHRRTEIIYKKDVLKISEDFNDLKKKKNFRPKSWAASMEKLLIMQ